MPLSWMSGIGALREWPFLPQTPRRPTELHGTPRRMQLNNPSASFAVYKRSRINRERNDRLIRLFDETKIETVPFLLNRIARFRISKRHQPHVNIVNRCNVTDHLEQLHWLYIMIPTTTKQWKVTRTDKGFDGLEFEEAPILKPTENEVLVRFHAVSLNYRDLMIPRAVPYS